MEYTATERCWIWISSVDGIGPARYQKLVGLYEDPREIWQYPDDPRLKFLGEKALAALMKARSREYVDKLFDAIDKSGVRTFMINSGEYPEMLRQIPNAPSVIYMKGANCLSPDRSFGIVGSRRCTRDGARAAEEIARELADNGVVIVSGLASGIDAAAHTGCLDAGMPTIAALGCGADVIYPDDNKKLYHRILDNGGAVISEYTPGTQPIPSHFPPRNRIISALSQGVMLVEGDKKSGGMITVDYAKQHGKKLFAVPGSIYSPMSLSPNQLIVDGVQAATSASQVLDHFGWHGRPAKARMQSAAPGLSPDEQKLVSPLLDQSRTLSELCEVTGFTPQKLNSLLTILELRGIIEKQPGGEYRAFLR